MRLHAINLENQERGINFVKKQEKMDLSKSNYWDRIQAWNEKQTKAVAEMHKLPRDWDALERQVIESGGTVLKSKKPHYEDLQIR